MAQPENQALPSIVQNQRVYFSLSGLGKPYHVVSCSILTARPSLQKVPEDWFESFAYRGYGIAFVTNQTSTWRGMHLVYNLDGVHWVPQTHTWPEKEFAPGFHWLAKLNSRFNTLQEVIGKRACLFNFNRYGFIGRIKERESGVFSRDGHSATRHYHDDYVCYPLRLDNSIFRVSLASSYYTSMAFFQEMLILKDNEAPELEALLETAKR